MEENLLASLKTGTARIRRLVVELLLHENHIINKYDLDEVASQLAITTDASGNDEIRIDVIKLIRSAFTPKGGGTRAFEYNIALAELGITGTRKDYILYVNKERKNKTSPWRISIGLFAIVADARSAPVVRWQIDGLRKEDKDELINELVTRSKTTTTNATNQPLEWQSSEALDAALKRNRELENELQIMQAKFESLQTDRDKLNEELKNSKRPSSASGEKQGHPKRTNNNGDPMDIDEDTEETPRSEEKPTTLYYVLDGQGGELEMKTDENIDLEDLEANITRDHLTAEDIMSEKAKKRTETYSFTRVNGVDSISPNGVTPVMTCYLSRLKNQAQKVSDLKNMFKKKQCAFTATMMRYIIAARIMCAMSDQTVAMMTFMVIKVMNDHFELGLTNDEIGNGTACGSTYANYEAKVAVECQMAVLEEMKKVEFWAMGQDAGNKKGMEHLIKVITYPIFDKNGNVIAYGRFCLDMDVSGKTSDEVAAAIIKTIERFQKHVEGKSCLDIVFDLSFCL